MKNAHSHAPRLELRQGQSLVMTQQLQQSIKLLQCNALELRQFVEAELEANPFLHDDEPQEAPEPGEEPLAEASDDAEPRAADAQMESSYSEEIGGADWSDDSADIERDYLQPGHSASRSTDYDAADDERTIDDNPAPEKTLRAHLLEQLQMDMHDPAMRMIGAHLIDMVDEAGYIHEDLQPLCEALGADMVQVEAVLARLQQCDPAGVCARTLKECLAAQLRERDRLDPAMQALLDNLPLLAEAKFEALQKKCGVDKDDLRQMIAEIKSLNPKPGSRFLQELSQAMAPDIFVRRTPDGNWHLELNMANFPRVMVNKRYYKKVTAESRHVKDKDYLSERFGSANWLVRALEQRAQTMLKVGGELVKQQDAFFRLGIKYLKPMTLKDIAAATGYHESTISRVTSGKFLICPRGTFELKYFFTSALTRSHGADDVSSMAVKQHIAELIKGEDSGHVLSDDDLVDKLKEKNINVARRTVAKYREALDIPSSPKRKRLKLSVL